MPIFQIDVEKKVGEEYFTNVYHVDADSISLAAEMAELVVNAERGIHCTNVLFTKSRISPYPLVPNQFVINSLGFAGERPGGVSDVPLFDVARVLFSTAVGRPGVKMYRGVLREGDTEGVGQTTSTFRSFIEAWGIAVLGDLPTLCKGDGTPFIDVDCYPSVGMRQLRRGSKRRVTPVI